MSPGSEGKARADRGKGVGMTCGRCEGLLVDEFGETRCLNCGHRPIGKEPQPVDDVNTVPESLEVSQHTQAKEKLMSKWSEESRASFREKLAQRKGRTLAIRNVPAIVKHTSPVETKSAEGWLTALDEAITALETEKATLERAKDILERRAS